MDEGVEVAHALLTKKVGKSEHFWEAKLLRHEITGDYKIRRRWKTSYRIKNQSPGKWHETDWDINGDGKFRWKLVQKIKFSGYKIKTYTPYENEPTLEMLQELTG